MARITFSVPRLHVKEVAYFTIEVERVDIPVNLDEPGVAFGVRMTHDQVANLMQSSADLFDLMCDADSSD